MRLSILSLAACGVLLLGVGGARAQGNSSGSSGGECSNGLCGTPNQSGGGCGCGCGSILIAMTDRGDTYQFADDFDGDGIEDEYDNCPFTFNYDQGDTDGDGAGDACDVCPAVSDPFQEDFDADGQGDACDDDIDGDGVANAVDNCPMVPNLAQADFTGDGVGDACDPDDDKDGIPDVSDPCRLSGGPTGCDDDEDGDGIMGAEDNCPSISNADQADMNENGIGDACDPDLDGDGIPNYRDNCRSIPNPGQVDRDGDGLGDGGTWSGAESCDPEECYVVMGDKAGCLNPSLAFTIKLGLEKQTDTAVTPAPEVLVGDTVVVPIFSNRLGAQHTWTARFAELPEGSEAVIRNARGAAGTRTNAEVVACLDDARCITSNRPAFEPDLPGRYVIQITAELPLADVAGLGTVATATMVADVGGEKAAGCNGTAGATSMFGALALALAGLFRRRR